MSLIIAVIAVVVSIGALAYAVHNDRRNAEWWRAYLERQITERVPNAKPRYPENIEVRTGTKLPPPRPPAERDPGDYSRR